MPTALIIGACCLIIGAISLKFLPPNNPVEETAEVIILQQTGLEVNISGQPEDKEAK